MRVERGGGAEARELEISPSPLLIYISRGEVTFARFSSKVGKSPDTLRYLYLPKFVPCALMATPSLSSACSPNEGRERYVCSSSITSDSPARSRGRSSFPPAWRAKREVSPLRTERPVRSWCECSPPSRQKSSSAGLSAAQHWP